MQTGVTHIPPGLTTIGEGGHGLAGTINHLYSAHQVNPLLESLYVVTNACNHEEYGGKAGFFDDVGHFSRECVPSGEPHIVGGLGCFCFLINSVIIWATSI
jgi:hypothetical protein